MENFSILKRSTQVLCELTAQQWQLFTSSMDCDRAARGLNRAVTIACRECSSWDQAHQYIMQAQSRFAKYGAADTEPDVVVYEILDAVYGKPERTFDQSADLAIRHLSR